jgi:predicted DCC family thiol-disulfide oxidoreductase YuxK
VIAPRAATPAVPVLLFNDECAVCRRIARWTDASARSASGQATLLERPIGDDPAALQALNPDLGIWDAYETIHLLMPDGSMKTGGEAVAEVFRRLPNCAWFAWTFGVRIVGARPFQAILNLGYLVLADVRPLFGCESCGISSPLVRFARSVIKRTTPHVSPTTTRR